MYENFMNWYPGFLEMLIAIGGLIVANWIAGVIVAIKTKTFQWKRVADILSKWLAPALGWAVVDTIQLLPNKYAQGAIPEAFSYTFYTALIVAMGAALISNIQTLGIPVDLSKVGIPPADKANNIIVAHDVTMLDLKEGLK
jgi:hypothetical protein